MQKPFKVAFIIQLEKNDSILFSSLFANQGMVGRQMTDEKNQFFLFLFLLQPLLHFFFPELPGNFFVIMLELCSAAFGLLGHPCVFAANYTNQKTPNSSFPGKL